MGHMGFRGDGAHVRGRAARCIGQGFNLAPNSCQLSDKRLGGGSNAYLACMSGALHVWELAIHSRNL